MRPVPRDCFGISEVPGEEDLAEKAVRSPRVQKEGSLPLVRNRARQRKDRIMKTFTVESKYFLPIFRHENYEARASKEACERALADQNWDNNKKDYDGSGAVHVSGIWEGADSAYSGEVQSIPTQYQEPATRITDHFPAIVQRLQELAAGRLITAATYVALAKAKAIMADEPDPDAPDLVKTPWGIAHAIRVHDDGILYFETHSHSGLHLDPERNARMPEAWRNEDGWYPDDKEWAKVVVTFPETFDDEQCLRAEGIVQRHFPRSEVSAPAESAMALLRAIDQEIETFSVACEAVQKTDTARVWEILHGWQRLIRQLEPQKPISCPKTGDMFDDRQSTPAAKRT